MESCRYSSDEHLSFKYVLYIAFVSEIPPKWQAIVASTGINVLMVACPFHKYLA